MKLFLALLLTLLGMGVAHAQTLNCVSPAPDGARCLVPGTGTVPAGTVLGTITSPGTIFQMMDPIGRYQLQGNNLVTTQPLAAGQRAGISLGPCTYAYGNNGGIGNAPPPAAYAIPWDTTVSGATLPQLASIPCATNQIGGSRALTVGGAATQAVQKTIQVSTDGVTWSPQTLTPIAGTVGSWYLTGGTTTLPASAGWVYVQFLVATKVATGWAYGGCSTPTLTASGCQPKWSVQGFFVPPVTINSVSVTPGTFSSATAVNWPITTVMSDSSSFAGTYYIAGANTCGFGVTANAVTLATMCPPGTYSDWQVVAVPNDPTIPTMSIPGGTATAGGATVASISASSPCASASCTIYDNVTVGTAITTFVCTMTDGSRCPPSGYGWVLTGQPTYVAINQTTGVLTTATPPPLPDETTNFNVDVSPITVVVNVASISPSSFSLPDSSPIGTQVRFTCTMSDGVTPCTGRTWGFSNVPSFLTASQDTNGGILTTSQAPPLPVDSGTLSVTAQ